MLREIYGRTDEGRHLLVVLADRGGGQFKIVTARDMTNREVQWFERR